MRGLEKLTFGLAAADADDLEHHRDQLPSSIDRATLPYVVEAVAAGEHDRRRLVERAVRLYLGGVKAALSRRINVSMCDAHATGPRLCAPERVTL